MRAERRCAALQASDFGEGHCQQIKVRSCRTSRQSSGKQTQQMRRLYSSSVPLRAPPPARPPLQTSGALTYLFKASNKQYRLDFTMKKCSHQDASTARQARRLPHLDGGAALRERRRRRAAARLRIRHCRLQLVLRSFVLLVFQRFFEAAKGQRD